MGAELQDSYLGRLTNALIVLMDNLKLGTTRFLNQPINRIVMTWSTDAPPINWPGLRDEWWRWHLVRLFAGLVGLSLLITAAVKRGWIG